MADMPIEKATINIDVNIGNRIVIEGTGTTKIEKSISMSFDGAVRHNSITVGEIRMKNAVKKVVTTLASTRDYAGGIF